MNLDGKLEIAGVTDVGRHRAHNEDNIGTDITLGLALLADGMGGYKAGEVASAMAITTLLEELRENLINLTPGQVDEESGYSQESLVVEDAIQKANSTIFDTAQSQPQCAGMGTTLVRGSFLRRPDDGGTHWRLASLPI